MMSISGNLLFLAVMVLYFGGWCVIASWLDKREKRNAPKQWRNRSTCAAPLSKEAEESQEGFRELTLGDF